MIFVQLNLDNFVDNSLSHTFIMFLLSLHYSFFIIFISKEVETKKLSKDYLIFSCTINTTR
jgi:hypothetical protein